MADLACLELARLAGETPELAKTITQTARKFARDYSERMQCSGALLIGLLGEKSQGDWLLDRYRTRRVEGGEKLPVVYSQVGLVLLGVKGGDEPAPAAYWLGDHDARTPGVFAALALSGHREALDDLMSPAANPRITAMLNDWGLRQCITRWVPASIEPIPAADADLARFGSQMATWRVQDPATPLGLRAPDEGVGAARRDPPAAYCAW